MSRTEQLKALLNEYDDAYYNNDESLISDAEYDALKEEYLRLSNQEEYEYVPGEAKGNRVQHSHPIRSLAKVNTEAELRAEIERLWPVIVQPKIDGLTVVRYPDKYVTRGNGTVGEDITATASKINGINTVSNVNHAVRMEAYMSINTFNELNKEREREGLELFKNPRNAAAGMLRNKDASKVKGIEYWAYNIVGCTLSEERQLDILEENNFDVVDTWIPNTVDEAVDLVMSFDRTSLDYEIDGMVIKSNIPDSLKIFGETGHHPKNAVAYKFPAQGQWTDLNSITWQVGRTGKITPVAEIKPVDIGGSTISRVTLHNDGIMKALNITGQCEVFVIKANDVIPAIIKARNFGEGGKPIPPALSREQIISFLTLDKCPICGGPISQVKDQIFCTTPSCPAQKVGYLVHLAKRDALDIEGLSIETAEKLFNQGIIENAVDIFKLSIQELMCIDGYGQKSAEKLFANIQKARAVEFKRFLYAGGLPNVGRSVSEDIAKTFGSWENFVADGRNGFQVTRSIEGIGDTIINSMRTYGILWAMLLKYVKPIPMEVKKVSAPSKVLTIVVTGSFEENGAKVDRRTIETMIKDAGHKASGSVSKKTDYVLVGAAAGSKATDAANLGIKILHSLDELKSILGE